MARVEVRYVCTECGRESLRWEGRCPACGAWNTLTESAPARPTRRNVQIQDDPERLGDSGTVLPPRRRVELGDLDLVLGGGLVAGCVTLLGGPPGVGKSTLLLQVAARVCGRGGSALYVSGEESVDQTRLRAVRVEEPAEDVLFLGETDVRAVLDAAERCKPDLLCVDSVQTLRHPDVPSAPGGVNQIRESTGLLREYAKRTGVATFLVGHVTKGGALAGPRTLEHLVDVVVHFEGPKSTEFRILRSTKNRFGRVGEVAVFRMTERGLAPVADPASAFLEGRRPGVSGSALAVPVEGTRPFLVEIQALLGPSRTSPPRLLTTGFPRRRLAMLLALLDRRLDLMTRAADVFLNVAGGLRLADPAADLGVLAALVSAEEDRPLPEGVAFIGEVGLGGEVRSVTHLEPRLREAERGGLQAVVVPEGETPATRLRVIKVADVKAALRVTRQADGDR